MPEYICDACGVDLEVADGTTKEQVRIKPCITCNEESAKQGCEDAYQDGFSDAENECDD